MYPSDNAGARLTFYALRFTLQPNRKTTSLPHHTLHAHCPTHSLDQLFGQRQAQARSRAVLAGTGPAIKSLPYARQFVRRDALACVSLAQGEAKETLGKKGWPGQPQVDRAIPLFKPTALHRLPIKYQACEIHLINYSQPVRNAGEQRRRWALRRFPKRFRLGATSPAPCCARSHTALQ